MLGNRVCDGATIKRQKGCARPKSAGPLGDSGTEGKRYGTNCATAEKLRTVAER